MTDTIGETTLRMERLIAAPPERVFDFWTNPALLVTWWGPDTFDVPEYALDVRPITVSNRRRDLGLEWDRYQGQPRPEKKRNHSVLKLTRCLCPKCRRSYHAQAHYTGRLPFRRFCDNCRNKITECQWPELPLSTVPHRIAMAV